MFGIPAAGAEDKEVQLVGTSQRCAPSIKLFHLFFLKLLFMIYKQVARLTSKWVIIKKSIVLVNFFVKHSSFCVKTSGSLKQNQDIKFLQVLSFTMKPL